MEPDSWCFGSWGHYLWGFGDKIVDFVGPGQHGITQGTRLEGLAREGFLLILELGAWSLELFTL